MPGLSSGGSAGGNDGDGDEDRRRNDRDSDGYSDAGIDSCDDGRSVTGAMMEEVAEAMMGGRREQ